VRWSCENARLSENGAYRRLIIGDFTAQIGDPSGKSKTRKQLTPRKSKPMWMRFEQFFRISTRQTEIYYNKDWLGKMGLRT